MVDPKDCKHENYDMSWSHGECPRCTDCGIVGEFNPFPKIVWMNDPLIMVIDLAECGDRKATAHLLDYLVIAKQSGFNVYDERLKELTNKKPA